LADIRVHQRCKLSIGRVPVAPKRRRLLLEGEKRERGFRENPDDQGPSRSEIMYMPTLTNTIALMIWSVPRKRRVKRLFFNRDPGRAMPQWGQRGSSALMSFLQFGQRIDLL
jgi:hypothetical protein